MSVGLKWAVETFGSIAIDPQERALRFIEEAIELVDAVGVPQVAVDSIVKRIYDRPQGVLHNEIGQAMLTLELLSEVFCIDPHSEAAAEFKRIQAIPKDDWTKRHQAKVDIGIAHLSPENAP